MRTFVISDIHGNNELFRKTLKDLKLKKVDKLIILGDLIDRGPDSKGVLDTIILLLKSGFDITCLRGNHEQMLLEAGLNTSNLNKWLLNGGDRTLFSFLTSSIEKIPSIYFDLIRGFKLFYENEGYIFVHAGLNMKSAEPYKDINTLLWERDVKKFFDENWLGNRVLVHGHTPESQSSIVEAVREGQKIICVDNGIYIDKDEYGTLCVFELEQKKINFFL